MKKIFLALFLMTASMNSFANEKEVMRAVVNSLKENPLTCDSKVSDETFSSDGIELEKAFDEDMKMDVNDRSQPHVRFDGTYAPSTGYVMSVKVYTDDQFKVVIGLDVSYSKTSSTEVNIGTIGHPDFQTKTTTSLSSGYNCK